MSEWWNDEVRDVVKWNEFAWKDVLGAKDDTVTIKYGSFYKKKKRG